MHFIHLLLKFYLIIALLEEFFNSSLKSSGNGAVGIYPDAITTELAA